MSHQEIKDALSEYRDGELAPAERAAVALHLESCAECRAELSFYERAAAALLAPVKAPTSFQTEALVRALRERLEPQPLFARLLSTPRWAVPALAFGMAAAALAVGLPSRLDSSDPAEAMLIAQDGGTTYGWLARTPSAAVAELLGVEGR